MAIKILLDPGHGAGKDFNRGYVGAKWKNEGDGNFYFSLILSRELKKRGFIVGTTRSRIGQNPGLSQRGNMARGYDLFISLHTNAGGGHGVEIYDDVSRSCYKLASNLCVTISKTLNVYNRGVKKRYYRGGNWYGVLASNKARAGMLIEHCFHDNAGDIKKYEANAERLASAMADTIARYYGMKQLGTTNTINNNNNTNTGGVTMLGNKPVAVISVVNDGDITSGAMAQILNYLYPSYNPVITRSGKFDYGNIKTNYIIGLGGNKKQHSGYINYFISGRNRDETLEKAKDFRRNKEKYKVK